MVTFPNHLGGGSLGYGPTVLAHCAAQSRGAGTAASGATGASPHRRTSDVTFVKRGQTSSATTLSFTTRAQLAGVDRVLGRLWNVGVTQLQLRPLTQF